ncbi:MAG: DUF1080 domain-containing protein [Planctomycetaceae bacterium]|nr:DUF1080 domain-containing protein [Planctomycetaceae bacterium]
MSFHSILRSPLCSLACATLLALGALQEANAQGKFANGGGQMKQGKPNGDRDGGSDGFTGGTTGKARFVNLLDSRDLSQFRGYESEQIGEGWSLDGRDLYFDGSGGGDLITRQTYGDFDLQVEWKVANGANSGIMWRVSLGDSAPYMSGPEYQILDDSEHADGANELTAAGSLYGMFPAKDRDGNKTLRDVGTWNKTRITVVGNRVTYYLNLKKVLETEIGSPEWNEQLGKSKFKDWDKFAKNRGGHIAFQDHGNEVWFRNIRIKRLDNGTPQGGYSQGGGAAGAQGGFRNSKFEGMQNSLNAGGGTGRSIPREQTGGAGLPPDFDSSGRPASMNRGGTRGPGGATSDRNSGLSPRNSKFSGMQNSLDTGGADRGGRGDTRGGGGTSPRNSKFSGMQNSLDTGGSARGGRGDTRGGGGRPEPEFDSSGRPSSMNRGGTRGSGGNTSDRNSGTSPRNSKFSGMQNSLDTGGSARGSNRGSTDRSSQSNSKNSSSKKSSNGPTGPAKL